MTGGSTVKLAYRDKRDYNEGKPVNTQVCKILI